MRGVSGDVLKAERGVVFRGCRLVTDSLGRHGNRSPDTRTRPRGASLHALRRRMPEPEARTRRPKNRHGGAPRGARPRSQGDARRLASVSACQSHGTPGVSRVSAFTRVLTRYAPRAVSALYSPSFGEGIACPRESGGER